MSICVSKTSGVVADHVFADSGECTGAFLRSLRSLNGG